jgi:hypothetical protein
MRDMVAAAVIEIHSQQDTIMLRAHFQHQLLLSLHLHDSVGIAKDI